MYVCNILLYTCTHDVITSMLPLISVLTGAKAVGLNKSERGEREGGERGGEGGREGENESNMFIILKYRKDKPKNGRATRQQFKKSTVGISFVAVSCMSPNLYGNQINNYHLWVHNDLTTFTLLLRQFGKECHNLWFR